MSGRSRSAGWRSGCCRRRRRSPSGGSTPPPSTPSVSSLIAAVYIGFAVADGRPKVIAVESGVAACSWSSPPRPSRDGLAARRRSRRPRAQGPLAAPHPVRGEHATVAAVLPRRRLRRRRHHRRRDPPRRVVPPTDRRRSRLLDLTADERRRRPSKSSTSSSRWRRPSRCRTSSRRRGSGARCSCSAAIVLVVVAAIVLVPGPRLAARPLRRRPARVARARRGARSSRRAPRTCCVFRACSAGG